MHRKKGSKTKSGDDGHLEERFRDLCFSCLRPQSSCICGHVEKIETKARFLILMHPMERQKVKNGTGRMTHLSLPNSEIIDDIDFTNNATLNRYINDEKYNCHILYPGEEAINISRESIPADKTDNLVIILIDATWPCAKKMMKLSKNLHNLPRISFDNTAPSIFEIKQQPHELCLSTMEATLKVLEEFKRSNLEQIQDISIANFLNPFKEMIKYQIKCATDPDREGYRKRGYRAPGLRTKSKKHTARTLIYRGID